MSFSLLLLILAALTLKSSLAFPNGAPSACLDKPKHGSNMPQTDKPPYKFIAVKNAKGDGYNVALTGSEPFKGFLIKATGGSIGKWSINEDDADDIKRLHTDPNCSKTAGVTHVTNSDKMTVKMEYILTSRRPRPGLPCQGGGRCRSGGRGARQDVDFSAIVVKKFDTFWVGMKPEKPKYSGK